MILPIGPIHPGLKEPLRLKLKTEGEKVINLSLKQKVKRLLKLRLIMVMFIEVLKRLWKERPGKSAFTYLKESAVSVHTSIHKHLQKL